MFIQRIQPLSSSNSYNCRKPAFCGKYSSVEKNIEKGYKKVEEGVNKYVSNKPTEQDLKNIRKVAEKNTPNPADEFHLNSFLFSDF